MPDGLPVVVVGGGIAGLAAAWQLQLDGVPVRLLEADDQVGGKIRTSPFMGRMVDEAADAFLARVPHGIELARELGLGDDLIAPAARSAQVWIDGRLQGLPTPNVLGVPLEADAAGGLLGPQAAAGIQADLARRDPDPVRPDDTIGSLVRRRLGDRVHEALVDPLIGAINAGDTDDLSLAASSPQIFAAAQAGPSLVAALAEQVAGRASDAPVFHSFPGGMRTLVDALGDQLADIVTTGARVVAIEPNDDHPSGRAGTDGADGTDGTDGAGGRGGAVRVSVAERGGAGGTAGAGAGEVIEASAVVLAVPAPTAATMLGAFAGAAGQLAAVPLVSVTLVALAYPAGTLDIDPNLSGFVVPRSAPELTITACSYGSIKWPHLAGAGPSSGSATGSGAGAADVQPLDLLRVSVGHGRDQVTPMLDDAELVEIVLADVATALGVTQAPLEHRISRWPHAFPQYTTGHLTRVAEAEAELNPAGVFVAGMSYRGIGIPANIEHGRRAARAAVEFVR